MIRTNQPRSYVKVLPRSGKVRLWTYTGQTINKNRSVAENYDRSTQLAKQQNASHTAAKTNSCNHEVYCEIVRFALCDLISNVWLFRCSDTFEQCSQIRSIAFSTAGVFLTTSAEGQQKKEAHKLKRSYLFSETSPWSSGKCVLYGAGRSRVLGRVLPRPCKLVLQPSYQAHGVRISCREHDRNTKTKRAKMNQEVVQNSVLALQDHCSYIVPTTKPPYQTKDDSEFTTSLRLLQFVFMLSLLIS